MAIKISYSFLNLHFERDFIVHSPQMLFYLLPHTPALSVCCQLYHIKRVISPLVPCSVSFKLASLQGHQGQGTIRSKVS